jgi:phosphomethylpyrimidine synthase
MNAVPENILNQDAELDPRVAALPPGARKIYVAGSRADLQAPMREIAQQPSVSKGVPLANKPGYVFDTSGPYTDPDRPVDIRKGLPALRADWIAERGDTVALDRPTSEWSRRSEQDSRLVGLRFGHRRPPLRAGAGCNVTQMH